MIDSSSKGGGRVDGREYWAERVEPVLVLLSNSYSELKSISVEVSATILVHFTLSTDYLNYLLLL